jgi:hypothetical protein
LQNGCCFLTNPRENKGCGFAWPREAGPCKTIFGPVHRFLTNLKANGRWCSCAIQP